MKTRIEVAARKQLLSALFGERSVSRVDVREITFQPGQTTPRHLHPCPVFGYIASGSVLFRREGQEKPTLLETGSAFYEPADTVIANFDNASQTEPTIFIACYLLKKEEKEFIQLLPAS
jgi:quercetin dioxygenase-like cupin family protein